MKSGNSINLDSRLRGNDKHHSQKHSHHRAFTLIELLTVISIIAVLIGIMSVGMKKATMIAKNIRQKVEMKAIEVGLELFSKDFNEYPDSMTLPNAASGNAVCGAQHLAEALVGRDGRGFEPATGWYPPQDEAFRTVLGTTDIAIRDSLYDADQDVSLKRRKMPYVEFKYSGVYTIAELWQNGFGLSNVYTSAGPAVNRFRSPVITDTFNRYEVMINGTNVKVGMPILYFKADGSKRFRLDLARNIVNNPADVEYSKWIYNFGDNLPLMRLPRLLDTALPEMNYKKDSGDSELMRAQNFYETITQTADATRKFFKPFNADKFILISAGWDGIYGTKDDISNFDY